MKNSNKSLLFSVICPFYNSELYILDAINSIISQSYKKWELILVNDGSTDNSKAICQSIIKGNLNIRLISKKHEGTLIARNIGVKHSNGHYVLFLDSDDILEKTTLQILHNMIMRYNMPDIVSFKQKTLNANEIIQPKLNKCVNLINGNKKIIKHCFVDFIYNYVTDKCIKLNIFKDLKIPYQLLHIRYSEDTLMNYLLFKKINTLLLLPNCLYIVRRSNVLSVTHNLTDNDYKDCLFTHMYIYTDILNNNQNGPFASLNNVLFNFLYMSKKIPYKEIKKIRKESIIRFSLSTIDFKDKYKTRKMILFFMRLGLITPIYTIRILHKIIKR